MDSAEMVIRADEAYPVAEFKRRAGLSQSAYRSAKRAGLKVKSVGKKVYVVGSDFLEFLNDSPGRWGGTCPN